MACLRTLVMTLRALKSAGLLPVIKSKPLLLLLSLAGGLVGLWAAKDPR
jgi:hypothetical protein